MGWKLSLVLKRLAAPALLETLDEERLPVVTQMLAATSQLYTHMVSRLKPKEEATPQQEASEDDKKSGWYRWRNDALELYGVNYRYSSIILEERDTTPLDRDNALAHAYAGYPDGDTLHAGDRAPEAPALLQDGEETTLFTLLTVTKHTVLAFVPPASETNAALVTAALAKYSTDVAQSFLVVQGESSLHGRHVLLDREGHAHKNYNVEQDAADIVIVRPDGFVGAIARDVDGVDRYFSKLLGSH